MLIKNILNKGDKPAPINKTANPWLVEQVKNGLKAVNVKKFLPNSLHLTKKIPVKYFENDRIYGRGAYATDGIFLVMDMFDELRDITPLTIGFVFDQKKYLYHNDGILRKDLRTKSEEFFSDRTLRHENVDTFFQLTGSEDEPVETEIVDEENRDRSEVYSKSTELENI